MIKIRRAVSKITALRFETLYFTYRKKKWIQQNSEEFWEYLKNQTILQWNIEWKFDRVCHLSSARSKIIETIRVPEFRFKLRKKQFRITGTFKWSSAHYAHKIDLFERLRERAQNVQKLQIFRSIEDTLSIFH